MGPDIGILDFAMGTASAGAVAPLTGRLRKRTRQFPLGWPAAVLVVVGALAGCTVGPD